MPLPDEYWEKYSKALDDFVPLYERLELIESLSVGGIDVDTEELASEFDTATAPQLKKLEAERKPLISKIKNRALDPEAAFFALEDYQKAHPGKPINAPLPVTTNKLEDPTIIERIMGTTVTEDILSQGEDILSGIPQSTPLPTPSARPQIDKIVSDSVSAGVKFMEGDKAPAQEKPADVPLPDVPIQRDLGRNILGGRWNPPGPEDHFLGAAQQSVGEAVKAIPLGAKHFRTWRDSPMGKMAMPFLQLIPEEDVKKIEEMGAAGTEWIEDLMATQKPIQEFRAGVEVKEESFISRLAGGIGPTFGAMLSSVVGGPALGVAYFYGMTAEQVEQEALKKGATKERAKYIAGQTAPIISAMEQFGLSKILKKIPAGKELLRKIFTWGEATLVEGVTEPLQDALARVAGFWSVKDKNESTKDFSERMSGKLPELFKDGWEAFKMGAATGGLMHGGVQAARKVFTPEMPVAPTEEALTAPEPDADTLVTPSDRAAEETARLTKDLPEEIKITGKPVLRKKQAATITPETIQPPIQEAVIPEQKPIVTPDITIQKPITEAQVEPEAITPEAVQKPIKAKGGNPETDSLATFIRKEGGLDYHAEGLKGELDRLGKKEGVHGIVRKNKTGRTIDRMLERAREEGYFDEGATPADFLTALEDDLSGKPKYSTAKAFTKKELKTLDEEIPQKKEFVSTGSLDLDVGDSYTVDGEKFTVKKEDEEGNFVIKDGVTQTVDVFDRIPMPDKGSLKKGETKEAAPLTPDQLLSQKSNEAIRVKAIEEEVNYKKGIVSEEVKARNEAELGKDFKVGDKIRSLNLINGDTRTGTIGVLPTNGAVVVNLEYSGKKRIESLTAGNQWELVEDEITKEPPLPTEKPPKLAQKQPKEAIKPEHVGTWRDTSTSILKQSSKKLKDKQILPFSKINVDNISRALLAFKEKKIGSGDFNSIANNNLPLPPKEEQGSGMMGDVHGSSIESNLTSYFSLYLDGIGIPVLDEKGNQIYHKKADRRKESITESKFHSGEYLIGTDTGRSAIKAKSAKEAWEKYSKINDGAPMIYGERGITFSANLGSRALDERTDYYDIIISEFRKNPTQILRELRKDIQGRISEDAATWNLFQSGIEQAEKIRQAETPEGQRATFRIVKSDRAKLKKAVTPESFALTAKKAPKEKPKAPEQERMFSGKEARPTIPTEKIAAGTDIEPGTFMQPLEDVTKQVVLPGEKAISGKEAAQINKARTLSLRIKESKQSIEAIKGKKGAEGRILELKSDVEFYQKKLEKLKPPTPETMTAKIISPVITPEAAMKPKEKKVVKAKKKKPKKPPKDSTQFSPAQRPAKAAPIFFSKLSRLIETKMPNKATPQQVAGLIKGAGIKQDEIKWSDIQGFLEGKKKVTKQEVLDYLSQNEVQIEVVVKTGQSFEESVAVEARRDLEADFSRSSESWGQWMFESDNEARDDAWDDKSHMTWKSLERTKAQYLKDTKDEDGDIDTDEAKELFDEDFRDLEFEDIYTPSELEDFVEEAWSQERQSYIEDLERRREDEGLEGNAQFSEYQLPGGTDYKEVFLTMPDIQGEIDLPNQKPFRVFDDTGFLLKSFKTRKEAQDLLDIRKKNFPDLPSYRISEELTSKVIRNWEDGHPQYDDIKNPIVRVRFNTREDSEGNKVLFLEEIQSPSKENIEKMPEWLQNNTMQMGLKHMLKYAADNGFDRLSWTTGEMQISRYDLSKLIDSLHYNQKTQRLTAKKGTQRVIDKEMVKPADLERYIGKDKAKRIMEQLPNANGLRSLKGEDLKVGGEGLKRMYDIIIPSYLKKYGKKWGARVGTSIISSEEISLTVQSIPITPSMAKSALTEGQPLFKPTTETPTFTVTQWQSVIKDMQRIIAPGGKVLLTPELKINLAKNEKAAKAWGLGKEGTIRLAGMHRTVTLDNGQVSSLIKLSMSDMTAATPYHEAFHSIYSLLLNENEQKVISAAFPKKGSVASEERSADAFAEWVGKKKSAPSSAVKRIFQKIKDFFVKMKNALKGMGFDSVESIFKKAYSGELKGRAEGRQETFKGEVQFSPADRAEIKDMEDSPSAYELHKDYWFGNKDVAILKNSNEAADLQDAIKTSVGEKKYRSKSQDIDRAIQIFIDLKRNPEHLNEFYDGLTGEQKRIVDMSRNLTPAQKKIAAAIDLSYQKNGLDAMKMGVIRNVLDNYAARTWKPTKESKQAGTESFRKFGTKTRHAKARKFDTILEGWAAGKTLLIEGATNNLKVLKDEIAKTIEDKRLLETLKKAKGPDGQALVSDRRLEGYERIEHPNFTIWKWRKNINEEDAQGRNFFTTENGDVFEKMPMYAPKEMATNLNNILGTSKLKGKLVVGGVSVIDVATKYNAVFKSWILQTSLFHHLAFVRSYLLGTRGKSLKEWNVRQSYKEGLKAIREMQPEIEFLVHNGLTLGEMQDWEESIMRQETTIFEEWMDKTKATKAVKEKIRELRQAQADFLFKSFGAGLKAKAALIEYRNALKKHPDMEPRERARMVASLINDDFGGLHLGRIGRDPTIQHIFRLMALAPDWTESNIRSMAKMIGAGTEQERQLYRHFWASIASKGLALTAVANMLLALGDDDDALERLKKAWDAGHLKWLDIDITPIYKLLGGKTEARKYFSIIGHFKDPIKFATRPIVSAKHKGSVFMKGFFEAFEGSNWQGKSFTSFQELLGVDDKGIYLTTTSKHKAGDPKGGKLKGKLVRWGRGHALSLEQVPSFALSQIRGWQPVQIQNLLAWNAGEMAGFDAIGNSLGFGIRTTYPKPGQAQAEAKFRELSKEIRQAAARYKLLRKSGPTEEAERYRAEHRMEIGQARRLKFVLKEVARLKKLRRKLADSGMSEERKVEALKKHDERILSVMTRFNQRVKGGGIALPDTKTPQRQQQGLFIPGFERTR